MAAPPPHPCAGATHPCTREDPFIVATAPCGSGALYPVLVLRTRLKRRWEVVCEGREKLRAGRREGVRGCPPSFGVSLERRGDEGGADEGIS